MDQQTSTASPTAPQLPVDPDAVRRLGYTLMADFEQYERDRRLAELKWMRNLRQYLGIYDPEIELLLDANQSRAYPRLTRVKCVSMLSRIMNLIFPSTGKNWSLEPTPVPNLSESDLNAVIQQVTQAKQAVGEPVTSRDIEKGVSDFAKERAGNLETEIEDQLLELGGSKMLDWPALCREVLKSGIKYGIGVLKGPMTVSQTQRQWMQGVNGWEAVTVDTLRPMFESISIWDYYPDMSARYLHQMDGQFQRYIMNRRQVEDLCNREDFDAEAIKKYLLDHPKGNYRRRTFESELKTLGVQLNVNDQDGRKYEIIVWDGMLSTDYMRKVGAELPENYDSASCDAVVWMLDSVVIKKDISPWVKLGEEERISSYHHFVFEDDESSLVGSGLPSVMRDSQMNLSAATRMLYDNASVVCGPITEVNTDLLLPNQDSNTISAYKVFLRDNQNGPAEAPAVREIKFDSHIQELSKVIDQCMSFADMETFVNPATGGDMQRGPSEPFRSAAGASMLRGDAALPFKDVVRNFDTFTQSVITALVRFNKHFNPKPEIQGEYQVVTSGATSLIAKEVRGIALDNYVQTLQPEERLYLNWYWLSKERAAVRDINIRAAMVDEYEAKQREDAKAKADAAQKQRMDELLQAEVRNTLADAAKAITQSDKNTVAAQTAQYNAVLGGLEHGLTPEHVAQSGSGAGVGSNAVPGAGIPGSAGPQEPAPGPTGAGEEGLVGGAAGAGGGVAG